MSDTNDCCDVDSIFSFIFSPPLIVVEAARLYTSSRRNFICRMKCGNRHEDTANGAPGLDGEYAVIHCTGFLRVSCAFVVLR